MVVRKPKALAICMKGALATPTQSPHAAARAFHISHCECGNNAATSGGKWAIPSDTTGENRTKCGSAFARAIC